MSAKRIVRPPAHHFTARVTARAARWLWPVGALYLAVLLVRYFFPPHVPRYQVESAVMIFASLGVLSVATRPGVPAPEGETPPWTAAWWAVLGAAFMLGALAVYAPAMGFGMLSDDFVIADWAIRRDLIHFDETGFIRPGVPLLWAALDLLPAGLDVAAHAANIILHAVNAVLVVGIGRRLRFSPGAAFLAGLLFLLHPALSEAIVWASGAQDVLMTTFCLVAVMAATSDGSRAVPAAVAATACALAVKETAVVVPVIVALVFWARGAPFTDRRARRALGPLIVLSAAYAIVRLALGLPETYADGEDWRYLAKQLIVGPFATLGAPWTEGWGRAHPVLALTRSLAIVVLLSAAFWTWGRRDPPVRQTIAAALWVLAGVVPVFSLFYVGPYLEGSRYVYLSAAGFALLLAGLTGAVAVRGLAVPRPAVIAIVAAVLIAPFLTAITSDIERWRDAARVRDAVLREAEGLPGLERCGAFRAAGDADHVRGAFVFRNGFAQALSAAGRRAPAAGSGTGRICTIGWSNGRISLD